MHTPSCAHPLQYTLPLVHTPSCAHPLLWALGQAQGVGIPCCLSCKRGCALRLGNKWKRWRQRPRPAMPLLCLMCLPICLAKCPASLLVCCLQRAPAKALSAQQASLGCLAPHPTSPALWIPPHPTPPALRLACTHPTSPTPHHPP